MSTLSPRRRRRAPRPQPPPATMPPSATISKTPAGGPPKRGRARRRSAPPTTARRRTSRRASPRAGGAGRGFGLERARRGGGGAGVDAGRNGRAKRDRAGLGRSRPGADRSAKSPSCSISMAPPRGAALLAADALAEAETAKIEAERGVRAADARAADAREMRAATEARLAAANERLAEQERSYAQTDRLAPPRDLGDGAEPPPRQEALAALERERDALGAVNLLAEEEAAELALRAAAMDSERSDLDGALRRLRGAIAEIDQEARGRLRRGLRSRRWPFPLSLHHPVPRRRGAPGSGRT